MELFWVWRGEVWLLNSRKSGEGGGESHSLPPKLRPLFSRQFSLSFPEKKENKPSQHKGKWREDFLSTRHCEPQTKFNCVTLLTSHKDFFFQKRKELKNKESRPQVPRAARIFFLCWRIKSATRTNSQTLSNTWGENRGGRSVKKESGVRFYFSFRENGSLFLLPPNHLHKLHGLDLDWPQRHAPRICSKNSGKTREVLEVFFFTKLENNAPISALKNAIISNKCYIVMYTGVRERPW